MSRIKAINGVVELTEAEYEDLREDAAFLDALRSAGVDNWDGYDYACSLFNGEEDDDE